MTMTHEAAARLAGWEIQPVCINGSSDFNGFQCYRHGMNDELDTETTDLFFTERAAWRDAWLIEMEYDRSTRTDIPTEECRHCGELFRNGDTCRFGGCPMGGDF